MPSAAPASSRTSTDYDVFIVGGGINGCGIARDAQGRGFKVAVAEMKDLGSGTSSWSTKLIHGGLRYLEHYEFRLVREALIERETLWAMAPHIIWPMRFVLPYHKQMRPAWLIRLGLFLYDYIGGRKKLPATKTLNLKSDEAGEALNAKFGKAFEYSDCWVNDARLVLLNAQDAAAKGADIMVRTKVVAAERSGDHWAVTVENVTDGSRKTVTACMLINAAGPWVDDVLATSMGRNTRNVRMVQGSHIVVRQKFQHDGAYFFQNGDGRIFFGIPYEGDLTLIGTTDNDYDGDPSDVVITDGEIDYLCEGASAYFKEPVKRDDIVWTYSGVRPLYDDGASKAQEATRDYVLKRDDADGAPMVNIFGGKITTYRKLAESMLQEIEAVLGKRGAPWTEGATLPGGDFPADGYEAKVAELQARYAFLEPQHARRLVRLYGTAAFTLLGNASSLEDLGLCFGSDLYEREVRYQMDHEWARTAEDVLWRRTKRGLKLSADEAKVLEKWMADAGAMAA
ncbi:MAG: glycerol-3-phosphate dehydrogenase [Pseudomonadota bacterium]